MDNLDDLAWVTDSQKKRTRKAWGDERLAQPEIGGVDWLPFKATPEPHRLSPEQFDAHPYAVFHSTNLDPHASKGVRPDNTGRPDTHFDETNWNRHHGTLQASVDRMLDTGRMNSRIYSGWHVPDDQGNTTWHYGKKVPEFHNDEDANPEMYGASDAYRETPTSMYYKNDVEDKGSLSVLSKKPSAVRSHEDYVGQAIAEGKEHEVHPRTLALYKAGKLSEGDTIHDVLPTYAKDEREYHQRFNTEHPDALAGLEQVDFSDHMNATHKFRGNSPYYAHTELSKNLGPQWNKLADQLTTDHEMKQRNANVE